MESDYLQQRSKPMLPAKFSYSDGGWAVYVILLSIAFFALGRWVYLHEVPGSKGGEALTGVLVLLGSGAVMALLATGILFTESDVTVTEDGICWSIMGLKWRKILWDSVKEIGVYSMYNAKEKCISKIFIFKLNDRKFFYQSRIVDDIDNFYALRELINFFIETKGITVKSAIKGEEGLISKI